MKLIIKKSILLENLVNTSKAISSKNLIPILTGIKFELSEEGLYLSASDSDISIRTFIPKQDITEIVSTGYVKFFLSSFITPFKSSLVFNSLFILW